MYCFQCLNLALQLTTYITVICVTREIYSEANVDTKSHIKRLDYIRGRQPTAHVHSRSQGGAKGSRPSQNFENI